ncbi:mitochondrial carrier [Violaceomyces palustris]|uniref:Mitochondrial carrier n=1 Tax=Violaceomyces palustris TaxID=1673888 RepID=A0ACD0NQZ2_9BASI|nr:mitochondrial carrier [Violaceomyces palustris]
MSQENSCSSSSSLAASGSSPSADRSRKEQESNNVTAEGENDDQLNPSSPASANAKSKATSSSWTSWISPSTSSAFAASAAIEKRKQKRPTFEEFRAQEPPQARLIRLRGLFDTLLDEDDKTALAGGRAKEEWTKAARRARWGAGADGAAKGSLSPKQQGDESERQHPPPPPPPRQSYAKELLSQCKSCRAELEAERARALASEDEKRYGEGWGWGLFGWIGGSKDDGTSESASSSASSSYASSISSLFGYGSTTANDNEQVTIPSLPDLEQEAGWTGSGVWGLSAVGRKKRESGWRRDEAIRNGVQVEDDGGERQRQIEWEGFLAYAESKERELFKIFAELDKNGDMRLDVSEIRTALDRAGIELPPVSLDDFIASLASFQSQSRKPNEKPYVTFPEFRDYLLLLPRKPSVSEIFRFYQVRKAFGLFGVGGIFAELRAGWGKIERGAAAVNADGEVSLAGEEKKKDTTAVKEAKKVEKAEKAGQEKALAPAPSTTIPGKTGLVQTQSTDKPPSSQTGIAVGKASSNSLQNPSEEKNEVEVNGEGASEDEEEDSDMIHGDVAMKFLIAGGIAGAVSRTATAPFDRLKIYLITTSRTTPVPDLAAGAVKGQKPGGDAAAKVATKGIGLLHEALIAVYREGGGLKAFWLGNGLNCLKIFPESAIKFLSYETAKRAFAKYVDNVSDSRDISGTSRFMSGGFGGITSQLAIYPIETLKTRLMSSQANSQKLKGNALLIATAKDMWKQGAIKTYYRGLTAGLIGVFPYSAIDMSTFEGIKLFYIKYTGREEPGVLALLAFGSLSGSVGATTVYPLNLVRTRLQAAGTPAHPQVYAGFMDAVRTTYKNEGVVGFYRGLVPSLAKVVPAVSISYVVYEHSKRKLGVQ